MALNKKTITWVFFTLLGVYSYWNSTFGDEDGIAIQVIAEYRFVKYHLELVVSLISNRWCNIVGENKISWSLLKLCWKWRNWWKGKFSRNSESFLLMKSGASLSLEWKFFIFTYLYCEIACLCFVCVCVCSL